MNKYILLIIISLSSAYSQNYENVIKQILSNNKEIEVFGEYLNSNTLESKFNNLPSNPDFEYSFLKGSGIMNANKQEFVISQPFEFPTIYSIKSDISFSQFSIFSVLI